MYPYNRTKIYVSPWAALLLAFFNIHTSPLLHSALIFAALCHELGHYFVLKKLGGWVESIHISLFGAEMCVGNRQKLSYGGEMLAVAAGPLVNILLALLLAAIGKWGELAYLFSGAQLILGLFNLLPVQPLDGGTLVWLMAAWLADPFVADRICSRIGLVFAVLLLICGGWLLYYGNGSPFLLIGAAGLIWGRVAQKGLVKKRKSK